MTEQQINAAIAEITGSDKLVGLQRRGLWYRPQGHGYTGNVAKAWRLTLDEAKKYENLRDMEPLVIVKFPIPDYCNDLNAMHEVFEAIHISKIDLLEHYLGELTYTEGLAMRRSFVGERYKMFTATARTRAEAFLRAHDKWEEVKSSELAMT